LKGKCRLSLSAMGNGGWYDQKTLDTDRPSHGSHYPLSGRSAISRTTSSRSTALCV
jgi:hypothetical protein